MINDIDDEKEECRRWEREKNEVSKLIILLSIYYVYWQVYDGYWAR